MKGFVIYLTVFFIVVSIFRAQIYKVDTNSSKFDHNPYLEKIKNRDKVAKSKPKKVKPKKSKPLIDITFADNNLPKSEQAYLSNSIEKNLSKKWYIKEASLKRSKLTLSINRNIISKQKYTKTINGKKKYIIKTKNDTNIKYKIYSYNGDLILSGTIPSKILLKAGSGLSYSQAEELASKNFYDHIGQKVANLLNKKIYYIINYKR